MHYNPEIVPSYEAVDLGLSVKWADRNIGATSPEAYGNYFAWGETAPRGENWSADTPYDWANTPFNNRQDDYDEEYFGTVSATVCPGGVLAPGYDAAHVIMEGSWRMPTSAEMEELIEGTTQSVEELNGIAGMRFTAPNENSIFIPFCGYRNDSKFEGVGDGYAWTSSLNSDDAYFSCFLEFGSHGYASVSDTNPRCNGFVVRGVCQ